MLTIKEFNPEPDPRSELIRKLAEVDGLDLSGEQFSAGHDGIEEEIAKRASGPALFLRMILEQSDLNLARAKEMEEAKRAQNVEKAKQNTPLSRFERGVLWLLGVQAPSTAAVPNVLIDSDEFKDIHWRASSTQISQRYLDNGMRYGGVLQMIHSTGLQQAGMITTKREKNSQTGRFETFYQLDPGLVETLREFPPAQR